MIVLCNDSNGDEAQGEKQEGENKNTGEDKSQINAGTITIDILPAEKGEFPEAVEKAIATLEKLQKQIGYLPGGLSRQLNKLTKGKVPWKRVLHSFVATIKAGMDDYSWNRPNFKRSDEIIYPGLIEYDIDNIVVAIDTSGSISQQELQKFASEVASLTHYTDEILLITTDAEIHEKIKVRNAKDLINKVKFTGGGGTDFRPIFEQIKKCEAMVFFTDGYATYPDLAPPYPVLWVLTKDNKMPPFGKVAYMLDE
jgi:predicted metal-dependent peptidase